MPPTQGDARVYVVVLISQKQPTGQKQPYTTNIQYKC